MAAIAEAGKGIQGMIERPFAEVRRGYTFVAEGDVLFAKITPCMQNGKHAIARDLLGGIAFASTEFHVLRPRSEAVIAEWVHSFLLAPDVRGAAESVLTGAVGQQRVPEAFVADLVLPVPPLAEQRRIVARLTEQLAAVERTCKAAEARVSAARECVPSYVRAFLERGKDWPRVRLADLIEHTRNGLYKPDEYYGDGNPILKMFNIGRLDGTWDLRRVDRIRVSEEELSAYRLVEGDILVNRVNSRELVGKCAVADSRVSGAVFESKNVRLRLLKAKASPVFVATVLNSPVGRDQFARSLKQIVGMATISRPDLDAVVLPLPPLAEQEAIAAYLTVLRSIAAKLAAGAEAELAAIEALPAAVLREAFDHAG